MCTPMSDWNDLVTKHMAKFGASKEEAEEALKKSDFDLNLALDLLDNKKATIVATNRPSGMTKNQSVCAHDVPPKAAGACTEKGIDTDPIDKPRESPIYAPSLMEGDYNPSTERDSKGAEKKTEEAIDSTLILKPPASATVKSQESEQLYRMLEEGTLLIDSSSMVHSKVAVSSRAAATSIPDPAMPPQQTQPGAVRVGGIDGDNETGNAYTETETTVESVAVGSTDPISAEVVDEDEERRKFQEQVAREVAEREREHAEQERNTRVKICRAAGIVLLIVAVVLGTVLPKVLQPVNPTESQGPSPQELPQELVSLLSSVSFDNGTALQTQSTPQNDAVIWLANNTNLDSYSNVKKIQRYVLATLFYSTNGTQWDNNSDWMTDSDECAWYSTAESFCKNGSIAELDFFDEKTELGNNLFGRIPNELALLSNSLVVLNLASNSLTGHIPTEIGLMINLTKLDLSANTLSGLIPTEICSIMYLDQLRVEGNRLTGLIPSEIGLATQLRTLLFDVNRLSGSIPTEIGLMMQLPLLDLSGNSLTGQIPTEIGLMSSLIELHLYENGFTGPIPSEIGLMSSLTYLPLFDNNFAGPIPSEIGLMSSLMSLDFADNGFAGPIPSEIGLMPSLMSLHMSNNTLIGQIPTEIALLTNMLELGLSNDTLTGQIPTELVLLTNLMWLDLSSNTFTGEFICPNFIKYCYISCAPDINENGDPVPSNKEECRSL